MKDIVLIRVYKHKKTGKFRVADHPPGQIKEWIELYSFMHPIEGKGGKRV